MNVADETKRAKEIIARIQYITIATVTEDGKPWNSPVYCAFDEHYAFYWASWERNVHSQNIIRSGNVFLVIYDSTVPAGTGKGVYMDASARVLSDREEILHATNYLYAREGKIPRKPEEFMPPYPRRIFAAVPKRVWVNADAKSQGNFVDARTEITL